MTKKTPLTAAAVVAELRAQGDREIAAHSALFFKTGPGEYGEGDRFLGVRVPAARAVARKFRKLSTEEVFRLLRSPWHEARLCALVMLNERARRLGPDEREVVYRRLCGEFAFINNWDLVDLIAPRFLGEHLLAGDRKVLDRWIRSDHLWTRRIAIMATFAFIRAGEFEDSLRLAERAVGDPEELIHKAAGWMLREVGKRDWATTQAFLDRHAATMPRTMLRYAIEHRPKAERADWLGRAAAASRHKN